MATVRIEDVKSAGLSVDVDALAASGFESISDEDRYRLKTLGICAQRHVGTFMLRIRVPGGKATPAQVVRVADLCERYGHPSMHVTTRGGLEIHHVAIGDVPAIFASLADVGLTTKASCGDTVRNVIACAHAGTFAGEVLALEPFVRLLHDRIVEKSGDTNVSRKMNVAIACSPQCDEHVATSDVGFVATPGASGAPPTFTLWGAGGLGATPRLAIRLRADLAQDDLIPAFDALVEIGKKYGDRSNRARAKIKICVDKWGAERFREVFEEEFAGARSAGGFSVVALPETAGRADVAPPRAGRAVPQKQPGLFTVPALVPMGELGTAAARAIAEIAERLGDGIVHLTADQNVELQGVAEAAVDDAIDVLRSLGLRTAGRGGIADVVSCVGLEYCPLAVAHSMTLGEELAVAFESLRTDPRFADFRIHASGCPHSCAKHQVADIGLAGAQMERDGTRVEAYVLYVGGNARERRLGTSYPKKIPREDVRRVVEALVRRFESDALPRERFSQTVARIGVTAYFETVAAAIAPPPPMPPVRTGRLVVIGNGMTGARFVEELRDRSSDAFDVTLLGDEPLGGYNRIMLSGVLGGFRDAADIVTHPAAWFGERNVASHGGARVVSIDRLERTVRCADGREYAYDALVFATGSRAFVPPIEGLETARNVFVFRTLEDCERIRAAARDGSTAVVIGGGLLGLEAAAGLHALGVATTVVHAMPSLMEVQLDVAGGRALEKRIAALGVATRTGTQTRRVRVDGESNRIEFADGSTLAADVIVVCCGTRPNVELARDAELACARGIVVDDGMRTSDERIFAIGECAEHRGALYGLVEPLWEQCRVLAARLAGTDRTYGGSKTGTRLKVAGVNVVAVGERDATDGDETIAASAADGSFRRAIARGGKLVGAQVVGDARAAASFARAFELGGQLPGSLAAFVFGVEGIGGGAQPVRAANDEALCICNDVSRATIERAIAGGARDVAEIGRLTLAGTGCGTCRGELAQLVIASQREANRDLDARP